MDEKNPIITNPPLETVPKAPAGWMIDFDKLLIGEEPKVSTEHMFGDADTSSPETISPEVHKNLLLEANAAMNAEHAKADVDISNIQIEEVSGQKDQDEKSTLGDSGLGSALLTRTSGLNYWKIVSISTIVITFSLLLSVITYFCNKYLNIVSQPILDPTYQTSVDHVKEYEKLWSTYTHLNDYASLASTSFVGNDGKSNLDMIITTNRLWYDQKKDILQVGLNAIGSDIITHFNALNTLKQDVAQYWYFPQELFSIFGAEQQDVSIKNSLLSLEIVKFSTAIKVFSYLDTFIDGLANVLETTPEDVQMKMQSLNKRSEKDIKLYLTTCYLNPFEVDFDCNLVGDFDTYYDYFEKNIVTSDDSLDKNFFKKLMYYIDLKLEQSDFPSFSIVFQWFNPWQKEISFNVEVNTFKQDETSLIKQWILNPHIFVVTQLLNLLKQSLFVVWENISAKQLSVQSRVIPLWNSVLTANSSSMSFVLPIQKNPQREISDFIINKTSSFSPWIDTLEQMMLTWEIVN